VGTDGLEELVQVLRASGRRVIGPMVRDGVITHDTITSIADLPRGWTEQQGPGTYRLEPSGSETLFEWATPATAWKRFLDPPRTLMIRARRNEGGIEVEAPEPEVEPMAFFGIRSCDHAALGSLDGVFLDPRATDPDYQRRRAGLFVVAVGCGTPGGTCFCVSTGTGPMPRRGYDLAVTELIDGDRHRFLIEAGTPEGEEILASIASHEATTEDLAAQEAVARAAEASMGRSLTAADRERLAGAAEHPHWTEVAERCLACGNCTMVCPTCFCSTTEDTTDLTATTTERWRVWDSCFTLGFTHMHGGSDRATISSRYRQWLLHKLVTWSEQFDTPGCVGCGRCVTWCPVGIDITAEAAALADRPGADQEVATQP
jgi:ferredoxin